MEGGQTLVQLLPAGGLYFPSISGPGRFQTVYKIGKATEKTPALFIGGQLAGKAAGELFGQTESLVGGQGKLPAPAGAFSPFCQGSEGKTGGQAPA